MKRLLIDTHALLWWLADDPALPIRARELLADPGVDALVSIASLWEIAIKRSIGKLKAPQDLPDKIVAEGFSWLPIEPAHVWCVASLPDHHRDAFDRLLVAQALVEDLPLVSGDPRLAPYGVEVCWSQAKTSSRSALDAAYGALPLDRSTDELMAELRGQGDPD